VWRGPWRYCCVCNSGSDLKPLAGAYLAVSLRTKSMIGLVGVVVTAAYAVSRWRGGSEETGEQAFEQQTPDDE
jgi:hypothetical protein